MKVPDQVAQGAAPRDRNAPFATRSTARDSREVRMPLVCACNSGKLDVVHAYLHEQFPGYVLRDLHAPTRLMQAGFPTPHAEHHVVCVAHEGILPYYAVLLNDFQELSIEMIEQSLRQWNFAETVRAHRIAIASKSGASAL
jgi:hypothetical protein